MTNVVASIKKRWNRLGSNLVRPSMRMKLAGDSLNVQALDCRPAELTMIFEKESEALRNFAFAEYSGQGEIVDIGAWAGGSTLAMAQGLAQNKRVDKGRERIHAYDIFIWEQWMSDLYSKFPSVAQYCPGDSFLPLYEQQIHEYAHLIATYPGDLMQEPVFPYDIEYLFVDVMKSFDLSNAALSKFFSRLIPGKSIVHHQDYNSYFTPWIHLLMYRFRDCFSLRQYIEGTPSTVFNYVREIPKEQLEQVYSFASFSTEEIEDTFAYSLQQVGPTAYPAIEACHVMAYVHQDQWDKAQQLYRKMRGKYSSSNYDIMQIDSIMRTKSFRIVLD